MRLILVWTALLGFLAPVHAEATVSATKREEKKPFAEPIKLATPAGPVEFVVTDKTEVKLDGKLCQFNDVPDDAVIVRLEISAVDDRTVFKIHFRSKK